MKYELVLLDIETQRDFFCAGGSCYAKGATAVASRIYGLFKWVRAHRIPVMSTVLRIRPGDGSILSDKPHCIEGTDGERKLSRTILSRHIDLGIRNSTDLPVDIFERYRQVIFEKRCPDIFAHARPERLISQLESGTFVICGAGLVGGIVEAAVGLRKRGFAVIVASDAVLNLDGDAVLARLRAEVKGVLFLTTRRIMATYPAAKRRRQGPRTTRRGHARIRPKLTARSGSKRTRLLRVD